MASGTADPSLATVDVEPPSACGRCTARAMSGGHGAAACGIRFLAMPALRVSCSNTVHARSGDVVELDCASPPRGWLTLVVLAFGVPVAMLMIGALLGHALATPVTGLDSTHPASGRTDAAAAAGALIGLIGGLVTGRRAGRMLGSNPTPPVAARIVAVRARAGEHD